MTMFAILGILFVAAMVGYIQFEKVAEEKAAEKKAEEKRVKFRSLLAEVRKERKQAKMEQYYKDHPGEKMIGELFGLVVLEPVVKSMLGK